MRRLTTSGTTSSGGRSRKGGFFNNIGNSGATPKKPQRTGIGRAFSSAADRKEQEAKKKAITAQETYEEELDAAAQVAAEQRGNIPTEDSGQGSLLSDASRRAAEERRLGREIAFGSWEGDMLNMAEGGEIEMKDMKIKYNEGSMLLPPEQEAEMAEELEDTYDNIPEDEMQEALDSQLPDAEMEAQFEEFVLDQALSPEEKDTLLSFLDNNGDIADIFDKVLDVAAEFSGEGAVEGIGTGVSDSIPARLSDGEFVFTKKAVDQIGAENLQMMMDDAERAFDEGGDVLLEKYLGGMVDENTNPLADEKSGATSLLDDGGTGDQVKADMLEANRMPSTII